MGLLFTSSSRSQQIGFNYSVTNKEVVFKIILNPGQKIIINYLDDYFGLHQLSSKNQDSIVNSFICKTKIKRETYFNISNVYIEGNSAMKYNYNLCCYEGDSVLIDCTSRPYLLFATRINQGELNYSVDSIDIRKGNFKTKDCDSAYYLTLQNKLMNSFRVVKDSISIYSDSDYHNIFKKSQGYRYTYKMQNYSEALSELFHSLSLEKKFDSCYLNVIKRFGAYFPILFDGNRIPVLSEANVSAVYGYILYNMIKNKCELSTKNAFKIIDSTLKGAYNINAKLLFINNEKNVQLKNYYLNKLQQSNKNDSALGGYITTLIKENTEHLPEFNSNHLISIESNKSYSIKEKLLEEREKLYLLDFWASWCQPCISAFQKISGFEKEISGKSVSIIYISIDDDIKKWKAASNKYHLKKRNSFIINPIYGKNLLHQLQIEAVPRYILIDSNGRIINYHSSGPGDKELLDNIRDYLRVNQ